MPEYNVNLENAADIRNLHEYLAIRRLSYADPDRFLVHIAKGPDGGLERDLRYLCHEAELPGRTFQTGNDVRYYGPSFKLPVQSTFKEMNLNFYVRDDLKEKYYFDRWMEIINPKSTYDFSYRSQYSTTIDIWQFRQDMKAVYKVTLRKAWPMSVESMPLSWGEDSFHKLQVTFAYTDWYNNYEKSSIEADFYNVVSGSTVLR